MIELTRTERITLLSLKEDDFIKDGAPKGITRNQYIVACKSLNKKGLARVAAVEGGDLEYAKLNTEGLALCDDLKELSNQTVSHDIPLSENALKVLELLCSDTSDNEIPEGMLECEYVDALRMLQDRGFITIGRSFNNYVISLQKNCIRDFNIIKKRRENNLTPLQAELLYKLSFLKRNETIDEIQTIEPFNELSDEEVYQSFNPLRTSGYIDFFGEDPALGMELPMYFKITNQGRNALRLYKEKHPEFHPRIENQNDPNNPYHLPDILNIPRANSIFNKAIEKGGSSSI